MRIIAVVNQKGGVGKTTTVVNLAAALGELRHRVLVLDLDPQCSASDWLGVASSSGRGLFDAFVDGDVGAGKVHLVDLVAHTAVPGVDVIPGSEWLAGLTAAGEKPGRRVLAALPARWDEILIDCPPSVGLLGVVALAGAGEVLVPVETRTMALRGLTSLMKTIELVREKFNPSLAISAILAGRVDVRTNLSADVVEQLRERFGPLVLKTVVRESVRLAEAPSFHQPITQYAPSSAGAEDFRAVARELVRRWKGKAR